MNLLIEGIKQICNADKTAASLIENRFDDIVESLTGYMHEIERFNAAYGLVKIKTREELIVKHVLDSLTPLGHLCRLLKFTEKKGLSGKAADIGSGGGFPGLPLAVCLPELHFTLIERMGKRTGFLRNVIAVLGLSSRIMVQEIELENALPSQFDLVVLRAVSPLTPQFVKLLSRLLKSPDGRAVPGGVITAYKGREETTQAELDNLQGYTARLIPLTVPFLDEQRCLAVITPWQ